MKKVLYSLVSTAFLLGLFLTPAQAEEAPPTIKIGSSPPLTGMFADLGKEIHEGHVLAVKEINKDGGVYVKQFNKKIPLESIAVDCESDPVKVVSRYETLYARDKVVAYLGSAGSSLNAAAATVAAKNKTAYLGVAFSLLDIHRHKNRYLFSPYQKSDDQARVFELIDKVIPKDKRPTKMAIWEIQDDWGKEQAEWWEKEGTKRGYKTVSFKKFTFGTKDFSPYIMEAKAAGAEMLLTIPTGPQAIQAVKQMKELKYTPQLLVINRGTENNTWPEAMGKDGDYVTGVRAWTAKDTRFPGAKQFVNASIAEFGHEPGINAGPAFACVQIIAKAIEIAGTLDRDKIRDAIAQTEFMTICGKVKFAEDGTWENCPVRLTQWLNKVNESVLPGELASAKFVYPMPKWEQR